jgi:hypothetical protein
MENIFNDILYQKLKDDLIFNKEKLDSFTHSLADIKESLDKIYNIYIPFLLENNSIEILEETIWDIREEFRHIDYHIKDADLTNISIDK